jgi:hypothetical protein
MSFFQATGGRFPAEVAMTAAAKYRGDYVEFDLPALMRRARPTYAGGTGEGVAGEIVLAMLDRVVEVLGHSGSSESDHQLQQVLRLTQALLNRYESYRDGAAGAARSLLEAAGELPAELMDDAEILVDCLQAPGPVLVYR